MKRNKKTFWTLDRHHAAGFTLVELIVVIAILAILAGVGIPVYSGYITKANKQVDMTLISEIENALTLAYYNGDLTADGYIILSSVDGTAPDYNNNPEVAVAMERAFGANWENMMALTHDGWIGMTSDQAFAEAYLNSSYNGNENALIAQVGSVTNMLKDALASAPNLVGSSFGSYRDTNKVDKTNNQAVSNAAILYAADTIGAMDATKEAAVNAAFQAFYTPGTSDSANIGNLTLTLKRELGTFGAVAALYAHGEAFGQYVAANGNGELLENFHEIDVSAVTDTDAALTQVANNLMTMVQMAQSDASIIPFTQNYIVNGQYANDVTAYLEAMKKIDANADKFTDKLDSEGCYTDGTADALLQAAVSAGSLNISCDVGEIAVWIEDGVTRNSVSGIQD